MKKVFLISSHCEDKEKKDKLIQNIRLLKEKNVDVVLYSTVNLENDIVDLCDYYIFSNVNPVLKYPLKGICFWKKTIIEETEYKILHIYDDYGWAGVKQYKNMLSMIQYMDYDIVYLMIYDVIITDEIIDLVDKNDKTLFFSSKHENSDNVWEIGSHLISINKEDIPKFLDEITLESYLKNKKEYLEKFIERIAKKNEWSKSDILVEDSIKRIKNPFIKEHVNGKTKVYIINDDESEQYGVLFYNVIEKFKLKINVDDVIIEDTIEYEKIVFFNKPNETLKIYIDDYLLDKTEKIKNLSRNLLRK